MIIFLLLNSQLQMDVKRMCHAENCCVRHRSKLPIFVFFLGSSCAFFFFYYFLFFCLWYHLIDSLAFRLDFMWRIGSHIDHRHRVIPHARRSTKHWTFVHSIFSRYDWHWLWKHHKAVSGRFCSKQMLPFDRTISTDLWLCSVITWRVF